MYSEILVTKPHLNYFYFMFFLASIIALFRNGFNDLMVLTILYYTFLGLCIIVAMFDIRRILKYGKKIIIIGISQVGVNIEDKQYQLESINRITINNYYIQIRIKDMKKPYSYVINEKKNKRNDVIEILKDYCKKHGINLEINY